MDLQALTGDTSSRVAKYEVSLSAAPRAHCTSFFYKSLVTLSRIWLGRFEQGSSGGFLIRPRQIEGRRLELGARFDTSPEQAIKIQRAIDYRAEHGIEVNVRFVQWVSRRRCRR